MNPTYYTVLLDGDISCRYTIQHSPRAKYLRIVASGLKGIVVVKPLLATIDDAHNSILKNQSWLKKNLKNVTKNEAKYRHYPRQLNLQMIDQVIDVNYVDVELPSNELYSQYSEFDQLVITGNIHNYPPQVYQQLTRFIKEYAKDYLLELLEITSKECTLGYSQVSIRMQRTLWGSCSSKNNISLNGKLLFFPSEVARSVCVHELCHTLEMNHSAKFWQHVKRFDPNYKQHRQLLKNHVADFLPFGI